MRMFNVYLLFVGPTTSSSRARDLAAAGFSGWVGVPDILPGGVDGATSSVRTGISLTTGRL